MPNKIRLGLDAKRAFCNYRGLGNYSRLLIEGLVQWSSDKVDLSLFTPKVSLSEYANWPPSGAHRVEPLGFQKVAPEVWRGLGQVWEWPTHQLDLYHGLSHDLPWNAKGSRSKTKTLVTIHDVIFVRHPELYPWWDRLVYLQKVKHSCEVADSIIAISEQSKKDLIEFLGIEESKIKVLYQAVHPRYYKTEQKQLAVKKPRLVESPYFLFVGAFEERKNILRLLRAFAKSSKKTEHQLVLVGKGGLRTDIESLISTLGVQDKVKILSGLGSDDLIQLYEDATAVTYPSLFEGFGLPIVEAMMSETLVMTSVGSCFPEAGGPGAFYVDPQSEEEITETLVKIVGLSSEERQQRIEQGLRHCQQFHWRSTTEKLINHYSEVLKK